MAAVREKWTDERLDDMNVRMAEGFQRVDADLRELRSDMNNRFEAMQRLIVQVGGGLFGTMLIGFLGLIVTMFFTQH
ncbi:MAG TPA: hypothetical protein VK480_03005 [Solirubrobacterales bacterium]|nr:hypothetical protein [Solirubrobacterales bacterium]